MKSFRRRKYDSSQRERSNFIPPSKSPGCALRAQGATNRPGFGASVLSVMPKDAGTSR